MFVMPSGIHIRSWRLQSCALLTPTRPSGTSNTSILVVEDFLHASEGHSPVFSFSTIPEWMFATPKPVLYPDDPNQVFWDYSQGTELHDVGALADYYARLAAWYTQGGFTDELGKFHASGHHYDIRYWEVFNEVDGEHDTTPQHYVERYDAITQAVLKVAPRMKFVALALSSPSEAPRTFAYFLDPKNHKPGVPLDYISFHVYATPSGDQTLEDWQYTFFQSGKRVSCGDALHPSDSGSAVAVNQGHGQRSRLNP